MKIKEAKEIIRAGLAWGNWTEKQQEAMKIAYKSMAVEELIMRLREQHQMDIYTVNEQWCIQLFELDVCANDIGISCDFETSGKNLSDLLIEALDWSEAR
jgi:hypothetical protein